jgi:hypothetical protein
MRCGSPIQEVAVPTQVDAVCRWDLKEQCGDRLSEFFGSFSDQLSDSGIHVWLVEGAEGMFVAYNHESLKTLGPEAIQTSIEEMRRKGKERANAAEGAVWCRLRRHEVGSSSLRPLLTSPRPGGIGPPGHFIP